MAPAIMRMALPPFRAPGSVEAEPVPMALALSTAAAPIVRFAVPKFIPIMPPVPAAPAAVTLIGATTLASDIAMLVVLMSTVPPVPAAPALAERVPIVLSAATPPIVVPAVVMPDTSIRPPLPAATPLA